MNQPPPGEGAEAHAARADPEVLRERSDEEDSDHEEDAVARAMDRLDRSLGEVEELRDALRSRGLMSRLEYAGCTLNLRALRLLVHILNRVSLETLTTPDELDLARRLGVGSRRCLITASLLENLVAGAEDGADEEGESTDEQRPLDSAGESESFSEMSGEEGGPCDDSPALEPEACMNGFSSEETRGEP